MDIPLSLHLSIHVFFGLLAGFLVWKIWQNPFVSFLGGIIGGVLVDVDHFIDYFFVFGFNFHLNYFTAGYSFLKSDRLYILFHGWEYVIILILAVFWAKNKYFKAVFLSLALGLLFHLGADVVIDDLPVSSYSVLNRAANNFELQKLVYPDHWQNHLKNKAQIFPENGLTIVQ